jgi:hypothetical protein
LCYCAIKEYVVVCRTAFPRNLRWFHGQDRNLDRVTLHHWGKSRPIIRVGNLVFLGLAVCVFTWGLQYKLSLYDPPQAVSRQIPHAKLLSKNEQSGTTENPLVVRTKTFTRVSYIVPTSAFIFLLLVFCMANPQASGQREQRANRSWHLRRAMLNFVFVRPPPILA